MEKEKDSNLNSSVTMSSYFRSCLLVRSEIQYKTELIKKFFRFDDSITLHRKLNLSDCYGAFTITETETNIDIETDTLVLVYNGINVVV